MKTKIHLSGLHAVLLSIIGCIACSISNDADRCTGIYEWDPNSSACVLSSTDNGDTTTSDDQGDTGMGGDAGNGEGDTASVPQGIGESCTSTESCQAIDAGLFCAGMPGAQYCTFDCTDKTCPSGFVCCVGTSADIGTFCMKETEYAQAGAMICSNSK